MLAWMIGFFLYDEIVLRLVYKDPYADGDKVTMQHSVHHWLGILYFASALCVGYTMPSSIAIGLIAESSTIWLNFRFLIDGRESSMGQFVNIMFALTYTVLRVGFLPYGLVLMWSTGIAVWHRLDTLRRICLSINLIVATLLQIMQFFWFQFVVINFARMCGFCKKKEKKNKTEADHQD